MSAEVGRRRALQAGALGAAMLVVGGVGTWRSLVHPAPATGAGGGPLTEPRVLASRGGVLDVALTAAAGVHLAGRQTSGLGYAGTSPGPTLRVAPGDVLRVRLTNGLASTTNLHTHGLHVSPQGSGDDVFRMVRPGATAAYEYTVPADHPTGTFWYHPHHHGSVADQVFAGLFGALLVVGSDEPPVDRDRVLVISDTTLTAGGDVAPVGGHDRMAGREGELVLVNGQLAPRIDLAAGTRERWRVVNACTSRFLELGLDEHSWGFLGHDGQAVGAPVERETVVLAPGNRADLLVEASTPGTFALRTLARSRGSVGMMGGSEVTSAGAILASVRVSGDGPSDAVSPPPWAGPGRALPDLRAASVDAQRLVTATMGMGMGMGGGGMTFGFDGRAFDPGRVDQSAALGTVEEWTISNPSPMDHPFHLHVWPMQVVRADDIDPTGRPDWRDVVVVPAGGEVTVRIRFADFAGRAVYHCHVLDHEDQGMMGTIQVA
jgi:FtsP/CotA-like multicopper oxidase with cupredoxin domain